MAVPSLLCRTAGRVSLNDIQFAFFRVFPRTIRQFCRQPEAVADSLFARRFFCTPCSNTRARLSNGFFKHFFKNIRILFKKDNELFFYKRINDCADFRVAKFFFCLSFKLRLRHFHRQNRSKTGAHVISSQFFIFIQFLFKFVVCIKRLIQNGRKSGFKSIKVSAAIARVYIVYKSVDIFVVRVVILH